MSVYRIWSVPSGVLIDAYGHLKNQAGYSLESIGIGLARAYTWRLHGDGMVSWVSGLRFPILDRRST